MPGFLATPTAGGRTPGSQRLTFTEDRWAPSRREKRKYASLFARTDSDKDGFISQSEAFQLAQRSGRWPGPQNRFVVLESWCAIQAAPRCFEMARCADEMRARRRTYHEFICFIHLITSVTRGARMPSPQEGLPPQLLQSLMNLEPLELLVAEREDLCS
eukprot:Skav201661  [mRNA]  locus=scaffold641:194667:197551:+ [translate_table: standard]